MITPTKILIQVEKRFEDEIKTDSGIVFYKDTSYDLEWNSRIFGTVVAPPVRVPLDQATSDVFNTDVRVGDKLYFNYNVLIDEDNRIVEDGKEYWTVDFYMAIAVVRDGKIIPLGDHILIEPRYEELKSDILITDHITKKELNNGHVVASNDPQIPEGALVEFEEKGKFRNTIEGKEVFVMYNNNILAIYEEEL
jgi:co-chaperonin GroES (HSP10)